VTEDHSSSSGASGSASLFTARELEVITAALLHFGAFCGASPPSDVTAQADGWQCENILRRINSYAADVLAAKLVPRIDTGYSRG
jgi:hypothetical protein